MPKIIRTMCDVVPEQAVLVRQVYLRNDIKAQALLAEARRRARDGVAVAEDQVQRISQDAQAEGYAAGILQAADALALYLDDHAQLAVQLQTQLESRVEALLESCVNDPHVVMTAFEECLSEQGRSAGPCLDLLLPERFRVNHRNLMARVQQHFQGTVNIEYRDNARFLMRAGDYVAEVSPADFVSRASGRVMRSLPSIYAESRAIADACRERLAALFCPSAIPLERGADEQLQQVPS